MDLRHVQLADSDMVPIAAALSSHAKLASLKFSSNGLTASGVGALVAGLRKKTSLTEVDLSLNSSIGDKAISDLARALAACSSLIQRLSFAHCNASDGAASTTGSCFRDHVNLQHLDLSGNRIRSTGAQALVPLINGAGSKGLLGRGKLDGGLLSLNMGWNLIDDVGASACALAGVELPTATLVRLDLSSNSMKDRAGVAIAKGLGASQTLRALDVSRNHLGRDSAKEIAKALAETKTLEVLKLGWNPLGTDGTVAIVRAVSRGPIRGRYQVPSALERVHLENTADPGDEYKLIEAVRAMAAHATRLQMRKNTRTFRSQGSPRRFCRKTEISAREIIVEPRKIRDAALSARPETTNLPDGSPPKHDRQRSRGENNMAMLATWRPRRDDAGYYYNSDAIDGCYANDWSSVVSRDAVKNELVARSVVPSAGDLVDAAISTPPSSSRQTSKCRQDARTSSSGGLLPEHLANLDESLRRHYAVLLRVVRHFAAVFSSPTLSPTELSRGAFQALFDALGLVDRRRLCANVDAMERQLRALKSDTTTRPKSREDEPSLSRADVVATLVLYVSNLLQGGGGALVLVESIDKLVENGMVRLKEHHRRSLLDPDVFRRRALYTPEVDDALRSHSQPLGDLYSHYAHVDDDDDDDDDDEVSMMSVGDWLRMLHDAAMLQGDERKAQRLERSPTVQSAASAAAEEELPSLPKRVFEGDLTIADARCCFIWGQLLKKKKKKKKKDRLELIESLTWLDFLDAICWLSLSRPLPSLAAIKGASWSRAALLHFFDIVDEPAVLSQPGFSGYIDVPTPPPNSPIEACTTGTELAGRLLRFLVVLYRGVARATTNLSLASSLATGEAVALDELAKYP
ncbi:hypothetical protein CTAYLR_003382 [Chrysophaeum taylorii]|uniref:Uncharacterized protein n=1 Tax=Chrysophaeum taylorii TaxID=2483200 RepID=A0AAD7XMA8_9STRA|nr:hypothetical protein CTAYLR_003382 [Chrysophaeum taylorii]